MEAVLHENPKKILAQTGDPNWNEIDFVANGIGNEVENVEDGIEIIEDVEEVEKGIVGIDVVDEKTAVKLV